MPKRENAELEKKDIILFKGDWAELDLLLAASKTKITPTQFIRHLVHNKIASIKSRSQDKHQQVETPDVLAGTDLSDLPHTDDYPSGPSTGPVPVRASKP